jgi:hypothetical protein
MTKLEDIEKLANKSRKVSKSEGKYNEMSLDLFGQNFFRSRATKVAIWLETIEAQEALEAYDESTTAKIRELLGEIGTPLGVHTLAILAAEYVKGLI